MILRSIIFLDLYPTTEQNLLHCWLQQEDSSAVWETMEAKLRIVRYGRKVVKHAEIVSICILYSTTEENIFRCVSQ
jgi:hypothetical protein